jgi:hypothetical protein
MDLDELKRRAKEVKAPLGRGAAGNSAGGGLERLIAVLGAEEERDRKRARRMMIFFGLASVFYCALFTLTWIFPPDDPPARSRLALGIFTAVFFGFAVAGWRNWRALTDRVRGESVRAALERAERSYSFIQPGAAILALPVLLVLTLGGLSGWTGAAARYFPSADPAHVMGAFWVFWGAGVALGGLFGWLDWKKRRSGIRDEVRAMLRELSRTEGANGG